MGGGFLEPSRVLFVVKVAVILSGVRSDGSLAGDNCLHLCHYHNSEVYLQSPKTRQLGKGWQKFDPVTIQIPK